MILCWQPFLVDQTISDYEKLAEKYHFDQSIHKEDIYGKKGKPKLIDFAQQSKYAMLQAENLYSIVALLDETLQEMEMKDLFDTIEMPLTRVLYAMEKEGVYCDKAVLQKIADETEAKINALSLQIYEIAGMEFNINSPKQLASVLYDELGLKAGKKRSTAADVLEKLVHVHPIIPLLLEHRKYQKIYSTYAIGLAKHILADGKYIRFSIRFRHRRDDYRLQNLIYKIYPYVMKKEKVSAKPLWQVRDMFCYLLIIHRLNCGCWHIWQMRNR